MNEPQSWQPWSQQRSRWWQCVVLYCIYVSRATCGPSSLVTPQTLGIKPMEFRLDLPWKMKYNIRFDSRHVSFLVLTMSEHHRMPVLLVLICRNRVYKNNRKISFYFVSTCEYSCCIWKQVSAPYRLTMLNHVLNSGRWCQVKAGHRKLECSRWNFVFLCGVNFKTSQLDFGPPCVKYRLEPSKLVPKMAPNSGATDVTNQMRSVGKFRSSRSHVIRSKLKRIKKKKKQRTQSPKNVGTPGLCPPSLLGCDATYCPCENRSWI